MRSSVERPELRRPQIGEQFSSAQLEGDVAQRDAFELPATVALADAGELKQGHSGGPDPPIARSSLRAYSIHGSLASIASRSSSAGEAVGQRPGGIGHRRLRHPVAAAFVACARHICS